MEREFTLKVKKIHCEEWTVIAHNESEALERYLSGKAIYEHTLHDCSIEVSLGQWPIKIVEDKEQE